VHGGICQSVHVMPGRPQVVVLRCSAWPKTAQDAPQREASFSGRGLYVRVCNSRSWVAQAMKPSAVFIERACELPSQAGTQKAWLEMHHSHVKAQPNVPLMDHMMHKASVPCSWQARVPR